MCYSRHLLDTNDKVFRGELGLHINAALAGEKIDAAVGIAPADDDGQRRRNSSELQGAVQEPGRNFKRDLIWMRLQLRNDKIRLATGMEFRSLEVSLRDTAHSLIEIAGLQPRYNASL